MNTSNLSIKKNILWNTIGSIIYLGCQWIITIVVARMLGYELAGVLALAMSVTNVFAMVALYSMRNFQISDSGIYCDSTYIISRFITCIIAILLCLIFSLISKYDIEIIICIMMYMVFKALEATIDVYQGVLQKKWRLDVVGKSLVLRGIVSVIIFICIIQLTHELILGILGMSISTLMIAFLLDIRTVHKDYEIQLNYNNKELGKLLLNCVPLVIFGCLSNSMAFIPRGYLEKNFGTELLGIYSSIATPTLIVQVFANLLCAPLLPVFTQHYNEHNNKKFNSLLSKCILLIATIGVIALIGGEILGELGLKILLGADILPYDYLLMPMILCTICTALIWFLSGVLTAIRKLKSLLIITIGGMLLTAILSPTIVDKFNMNGVSIIQIICQIIMILGMLGVCIKANNKNKGDMR